MQPVKFVEFCGIKNKINLEVYDDNGITPKSLNSLEYIGLPCECQSNGDVSKCEHTTIMNDTNILKFSKNLFFTENR